MINIDRVRERLDALGLNPNAASQKAELNRDYVRDILRGRIREPSALRLTKLAQALECSPEYLLSDTEGDSASRDRPADDREASVAHSLSRLKSLEKGAPSLSVIFDMLDSVSDSLMLEMAYSTFSTMINEDLAEFLLMSEAEQKVVLGERSGEGPPAAFERRAVLAKSLKLVDEKTYYAALSLGTAWRYVREKETTAPLRDPGVREFLWPLLSAAGVPKDTSSENVRLAIIAAVARLVSPASAAAAADKAALKAG